MKRDARQIQILTAVREVTRTDGIEKVTAARVAAAAGVPVGMVVHHYRSTDALLADAFDEQHERLVDRIDQQAEISCARDARMETTIGDALTQMLPLSPRRRDDVNLSAAFAELTRDHDTLTAHLDAARGELERRIAELLVEGRLCGEVDDDLDCSGAALAAVSMAEGLAVELLDTDDAPSRTRALAVVAELVAQLCPGECHHGGLGTHDLDEWD